MMRKLLIAAGAIALIATAAYAIQPGTTGTNKQNQNSGFRTGVLIQKNNTATASGGAATLNAAGSGIITTEALATAAGSSYTLTLTNNMIGASDLVFATVQYGTSTVGQPYIKRVTPSANQVVIQVGNATEESSSVFNGTLKIGFFVLKQSANGQD